MGLKSVYRGLSGSVYHPQPRGLFATIGLSSDKTVYPISQYMFF